MLKTLSLLLLLFSVAVGALAQTVTLTPSGTINCGAQGCQGDASQGDTMYWGAWSHTGSFVYNGVTIPGAVYGTLNDGETRPCSAIPSGGQIMFLKLARIDFNTPGNGGINSVNCMGDYGTSGFSGWAPAQPGTCTSGVNNGCTWKSVGVTHVNGKVYLQIFRQEGPSAFYGHDSTVLVSSDEGGHWLNPAHIGRDPSATGDAPAGPGSGDYANAILWQEPSPFDGSTAKMARVNFVHYCQDESIGCPDIDNNATYTYMWATDGRFSNYTLARWPKASMPALDKSTMQYYVCPGYATRACDGSVDDHWTSTIASATSIASDGFGGTNASVVWLERQQTYLATSWNGNGTYYISTAPHVWGPWKIRGTYAPRGVGGSRSVFTNIVMPSIVSKNSAQAQFVVANVSSILQAAGTLYFDRYQIDLKTIAPIDGRLPRGGIGK